MTQCLQNEELEEMGRGPRKWFLESCWRIRGWGWPNRMCQRAAEGTLEQTDDRQAVEFGELEEDDAEDAERERRADIREFQDGRESPWMG
jgi:hypothetical protein